MFISTIYFFILIFIVILQLFLSAFDHKHLCDKYSDNIFQIIVRSKHMYNDVIFLVINDTIVLFLWKQVCMCVSNYFLTTNIYDSTSTSLVHSNHCV